MLRAYDYQCDEGHQFELFLDEYKEVVPCEVCNAERNSFSAPESIARHVWSFYYNSTQKAQRFDPVVIHKDINGNIRFPGEANAQVPEGFQRVELTTIQQVRQIEKEWGAQDQTKANQFRAARQTLTDGQLKENRRVMESIVRDRFSPRGRKFYEAMKKVSEEKQRLGPKAVSPAAYFDAFSNDSTNRDIYYNENTQHGNRIERR